MLVVAAVKVSVCSVAGTEVALHSLGGKKKRSGAAHVHNHFCFLIAWSLEAGKLRPGDHVWPVEMRSEKMAAFHQQVLVFEK